MGKTYTQEERMEALKLASETGTRPAAERHYAGSYRTVRHVCLVNNLTIKRKRKPNGMTCADTQAQKIENLIRQDFTATKPGEKWLTDITEIQCKYAKLYLSPVMDCFDGAIVAFTMGTSKEAKLCSEAFEQACRKTKARVMVRHSDRGSQYTSNEFRRVLKKHHARQSMSGTGRCYDNARMESFFETLKKEKLYKLNTAEMSVSEVRSVIYRYIAYYKLRRIYSTNGDYPPMVYRRMYYAGILAA